MHLRATAVLLALLLVAACAPDEPDAEAAPGPDDPQEPDLQLVGEPEPLRTEDGVTDQLRAYFPPPEPGAVPDEWEPEVTDWHPADVPEGFGEGAGYDSPGALVTALAERLHCPRGATEVNGRPACV